MGARYIPMPRNMRGRRRGARCSEQDCEAQADHAKMRIWLASRSTLQVSRATEHQQNAGSTRLGRTL